VQAQQEPVTISDPPGQRSPQLLRPRLDAALHQGKQPVRIALAIDQRLEDGAGHPWIKV
jgi:hypothetical protein